MPFERQLEGYLISDDPARLDVGAIHAYLQRSYWAEGIPRETVARSLQHSLGIGLYDRVGAQVGFARVISDYATFAYLCDVYVLEPHRGRSLSKAALQYITDHPRLQGLRRFQLVTRDAQRLYASYGFAPLTQPERHMAKIAPNPYQHQ